MHAPITRGSGRFEYSVTKEDALKFPFDEAIRLTNEARRLIPRGRSLLYHGSRSPNEILRGNELRFSDAGLPVVSFSRLLHVGIYWATLKREAERLGAVFVLDRDLLARNYRLEPFRDPIWDDEPERRERRSSEAEEHVWGRDVVGLNKFLVDVMWIWHDGTVRSAVNARG